MAASVFLSHSSRDNAFCDRLALDLNEYEVKVWYDEWEIKVGDSLRGKIAAGIESNDYLAVVLSPASVESDWVQQELNAALAKELREQQVVVLPLLIEDCNVPVFLQDKKWADFRAEYNQGLRELLQVLGVRKRKRRRSVTVPRGTRQRNDELALRPCDFEQWFLDRLEEGNEIRFQRYLWNWRDAVGAINAKVVPDEIASRQIDIDDVGRGVLEKLAIAGNVLVRYGQERWFGRMVNVLYDAYLHVNSWGLQAGASADMNVKPSAARCRILDVIFAVGAAGIDEARYDLLQPTLDRTTPDEGYWGRRGWFRYTLTMAARGERDKRASWFLPVPRAIDYVRSRPELGRYFHDDERITDCVCQFDLLQCMYWVLHSDRSDRMSESYPSCALYAPRRVEPLVRSLIERGRPASLLGDFSDGDLASMLREFADIVRDLTFYTGGGWGNDEWQDPVVRRFLASHRESPEK